MAKSKSNHSQKILLISIAACVMIVVIGITLYFVARDKQTTYFSTNEVKVLEFDTSTGPVSPEFQESKTLILTPTTCSYTVTKIQPQSTNTTTCPMNDTIWGALVSAFDSNGVKKVLEMAPQESDLIGGPQKQFTAIYANGDTYKAFVDPKVKAQLQNFLQQAQTQVPDVGNISF